MFEALERIDFEEGSVAVHSLRLSEHEYKREGELDFVVVAPSGLFVLEVKGGGVARDRHGVWQFTDRYGRRHEKQEGPFEQARSGMYSLRDALYERFGDDLRHKMTYGFGVVFPDCRFDIGSAEWDRDQILDAEGFNSDADLERFLKGLRDYYQAKRRSPRRLASQQMDRIVSYLRPKFDRAPSLLSRIGNTHEVTESLTKEQYTVIDGVDDYDRVLCRGGAGTGKTFVAMEAARRHASRGLRVLVTCRSPSLASFLKSRLQGERGIDVIVTDKLTPPPELYQVAVVDEGQDLLTLPYLSRIDAALEGGLDEGTWRFFYDPNKQSGFYEATTPDALVLLEQTGPARVRLTRNCRNPLPIVRQTRLYTGGDLGEPAAGEGPEVTISYVRDDTGAIGQLTLRLRELFREGAPPGAISILSPRPLRESSAARLLSDLRSRLRPLDASTASAFPFPAVSFSSVRDFKGLENDFVIITDVRHDDLLPSPENFLYVAMSRARIGLTLILPDALRDLMGGLAEAHLPLLRGSNTEG